MKKLFSIAAAVLASACMFAADYDPAATAVYTVGDTSTFGAQWKTGLNQNANYFEVADTVIFSPYVLYQSAGSGWQEWTGSVSAGSSTTTWDSIAGRCFKGSAAMFSSGARCATVRSSRVYKYNVTNCIQVMALVKSSSSITLSVNAYEIENDVISSTPAGTATYKNGSNGIVSLDGLDKDKTYRIEILTDNSGSNSSFYEIAFVHPHPCQDPEFTVSEGGVGFVGDVIDIAVTSKNKSKPINSAVTVDGVPGEYGTDYTFSVSTGLIQATPLRPGRFVITFTQASNGEYCDAVDSAIYVISEKTPVTSFEVQGPSEAHVGEVVKLIATNFDAAPTSVNWIDTESGDVMHTGDTLTVTLDEAGEYYYEVRARNNFNSPDSEEDGYDVAVMGSVEFFLGTNVDLGDLKVNGATIQGFDETVFDYNLGEIGVYDKLTVEAVPEDAPYATAAVVDNGEGVITITVTAQNESTRDYTITYTRAAATQLAFISASATWDFTKTGATTIQLSDNTLPTKSQEFVYADMLTNPDASFNAAALAGIQEYVVRDGKYAQGSQLRFVTTVPGTLEVVYCNTGNRSAEDDRRFLAVNGVKIGDGSMKSSENVTESNIPVAAGEVVLSGILKKDDSAQYLRFHKVVFTPSEATAIENAAVEAKAVKTMINGQLFILRDGKTYDVHGVEVR